MSNHPILKLPRPTPERARALVCADPRSVALLAQLGQIAPSDAAVLVTGETGTGKEIVARELHARSRRCGQPFVAVNCGALTPSLIESELFGHDRGAFTGAAGTQLGWFETADGGTLFLDELGELPLAMQVKLLRVLQERQVVRLGSRRPLTIDVRLVAATNVDLEAAVAAGRFRADLFYRLDVARLDLPPLRERRGDILPAAAHFLAAHTARDRRVPTLTEAATTRLLDYAWPGNFRQLENVIQQALLLCPNERLDAADLRLPAAASASAHSALERQSTAAAAAPESLAPALSSASSAAAPESSVAPTASSSVTAPAVGPSALSCASRAAARESVVSATLLLSSIDPPASLAPTAASTTSAAAPSTAATDSSGPTAALAAPAAAAGAAASLAPPAAVPGAAASLAPPAAAPAPDGTADGDGLERVLLGLFEAGLPELHKRIEQQIFRVAYRYAQRNQLQTARLLGISRNIVRARLIELGEISSATRPPPPRGLDLPPTDRQAP